MKFKVNKDTAIVLPSVGVFWGKEQFNGGYKFSISLILFCYEFEVFFFKTK